MASGSELLEASEVVPTWEVGPTEDVVGALMETLVDPLLPLSVSNVPPEEDDQISVAKQMHAVVLLYNYHHRKQKPELKFLDFVSFCKLALTLKPPLVSFMKLMNESEPKCSDIANDLLSLTEKAIKDACNIALAVDACRDFPIIEGWPISKVAVLLIDSKKKNCMLRYGDVTKGVWSLIEKVVNAPKINPEIMSGEKIGDKRKRSSFKALIYDKEFLNLAHDAVKEVAGIDSADLQVLGSHVTYSLSQEKTTVRFYLMQCSRSFNIKEEVSLKFLVESLQGPLAEKVDNGFWKTTTVIEFYHMLPYLEFISCWLSGKEICLNSCKKELTQTGTTLDLPIPKHNGNVLVENGSGTKVNTSEIIATEDHNENGKVKSLVNLFQSTAKDGNDTDIDSEARNKKSRVSIEASDTDSEKTVIDDNVIKTFEKIRDIGVLDKDGDECGLEKMNTDELTTKTCNKSDDTSNANPSLKIRVYHHRKKNNSLANNDARVCEDGDNLKVNNVDSLKPHRDECGNEKVVSEDKGDVTISCDDQNVIAPNVNQLVQFENNNENDLELQSVSASEVSQNALALLYRKRQELHSQICDAEDKLASYENVIVKIRDGGEVDLARKCLKSIITGNYSLMLGTRSGVEGNTVKSQREKQTGLSEIYLVGESSCQDLEYTCVKNNWSLPSYRIEPFDGKFVSDVFVRGKDNEFHSKGGFKSEPCEARESAAAQMIAKLRNFYESGKY